MFAKNSEKTERTLLPGVTITPLTYGEMTNLGEFRLTKGFSIPPHLHPYEQIGYLVSGKLRFRIGSDWFNTDPGDSWCIPVNVEHEVVIIEDSLVIEIFSPVRKDYL
jgi:quercetin dioxygenase-like cupin family protein